MSTHKCRCGSTLDDEWVMGSPVHAGCSYENGGNFIAIDRDIPGMQAHYLLCTVGFLNDVYSPQGVQMWLRSKNSLLDDREPVRAILEGDAIKVWEVARTFAGMIAT